MTVGPTPPTRLTHGPQKPDDDARLRKTASQLEGLFVQKMFAAMRQTVDTEDGLIPTSTAEDNFTQMLDEKFSEQVPAQFAGPHSLAAALYHQLRRQLPGADTSMNAAHPAARIDTAVRPAPAAPMALRSAPASAPTGPAKL